MSLRFAPARLVHRSPVARALARCEPRAAANDNGAVIAGDTVLRAVLEHFASHGLGAARAAGRQAERARADNDDAAFAHWLGICRMLDGRLAARIGSGDLL